MKEDWSGDREQASRCLFRTILLWGVYLSEVTDPCENMIIDILFLNITHVYIKKKGTLWRQFLVSTNEVKRFTVSFNLLLSWPFSVHCLNGSFMSSQTLTHSLLHRHQHQLTGGAPVPCGPERVLMCAAQSQPHGAKGTNNAGPQAEPSGGGRPRADKHTTVEECWQDTGQKQSRLHLRHFAEERTGGRLWAGPDVDFSGRRSQRMSLRTIV